MCALLRREADHGVRQVAGRGVGQDGVRVSAGDGGRDGRGVVREEGARRATRGPVHGGVASLGQRGGARKLPQQPDERGGERAGALRHEQQHTVAFAERVGVVACARRHEASTAPPVMWLIRGQPALLQSVHGAARRLLGAAEGEAAAVALRRHAAARALLWVPARPPSAKGEKHLTS